MRKLLVIGIGTGNPQHMTFQAVEAMNSADIVLIPRKGAAKADLAGLRRDICERFLTSTTTRIVEFDLPVRDASGDYRTGVGNWHQAIADAYLDVLEREKIGGDGSAAMLVWGDPSLYDSTLRIIERMQASAATQFKTVVIPGITSIQALCASHAIPLNRIGDPVLITTSRRLRDGFPAGVGDVVVMLDGECGFQNLKGRGLEIFWGAYLGTEDEIIVSGALDEVSDHIVELRQNARAAKGWIMDVYLLRAGQPHS